MQYHLDGFQPGDPHVQRAAQDQTKLDKVDVAIIGCGPAGLTLAAQLAAFPSVSTRIFDQRSGPLEMGQADGIACRSVEMFQAFGFAEKVLKEAYWVNETTFWRPGPDGTGLGRADRIQDVEDDLSDMPHVILSQARVHDFFLETMRNAPTRLTPDYGRKLVAIERHEGTTHPIHATFECLDAPGTTETVKAQYLVGCDGARSTVRGWMRHELKGDAARQLWGVMDVLAVTDFPDIRLKSAIQSADKGSILIIPREGGYLVRLYIELDALHGDERASDRQVTPQLLEQKAKEILAPFTFEVKEVAWCSAYEIGQRACDAFDDVAPKERSSRMPNVFIAGDACHTHSPKAGQGMNVSMADTFNLGWKLAAVIRKAARPELLLTYSDERQAKAKELIDFDRDMARLFSAKPTTEAERTQFQQFFQKHGRYTAGVETFYARSMIVGSDAHQDLAAGLTVGRRFHSAPVIRLADARPMQLGHALLADGRWRIIAFADQADTGGPTGKIARLCSFLEANAASPIRRYTPFGANPDSVIDFRAVFQQGHRSLPLENMPNLLMPGKGRYGVIDYEKVFCPDIKSGSDIFDLRAINRDTGALVVVRPDQFVSLVLPLEAFDELSEFFDGICLMPQRL